MYQTPVARAIGRKLSGKAYAKAMLWELQFALVRGNLVMASGRELAAATGFNKNTVTKALNELEQAFAIRRREPRVIEVNPYLAWVGSEATRDKECTTWSGEMAALAPEVKALARDATGKVVQLEAVQ